MPGIDSPEWFMPGPRRRFPSGDQSDDAVAGFISAGALDGTREVPVTLAQLLERVAERVVRVPPPPRPEPRKPRKPEKPKSRKRARQTTLSVPTVHQLESPEGRTATLVWAIPVTSTPKEFIQHHDAFLEAARRGYSVPWEVRGPDGGLLGVTWAPVPRGWTPWSPRRSRGVPGRKPKLTPTMIEQSLNKYPLKSKSLSLRTELLRQQYPELNNLNKSTVWRSLKKFKKSRSSPNSRRKIATPPISHQ